MWFGGGWRTWRRGEISEARSPARERAKRTRDYVFVNDRRRRFTSDKISHAFARLAKAVGTLSTLRDVPWNAPFYGKLGFRILVERELTQTLRELLESEARLGLPMKNRVLMRREL